VGFFRLDDESQKRIAHETGARIAEVLSGESRWDASDEKEIVTGTYAGHPVRVRLDATFGTLWFEMNAEPRFPSIGQLHLAQDSDKKAEQSATPPRDDFEDPTRRDDFTYFVTDTVHAGDGAPDAAFTLDMLERLPTTLRDDLLTALEPDHSHFTLYDRQILVRCGGEQLGEPGVEAVVEKYLSLLIRLNAAFRAIWRVE
jgi:hypothetical protein